METMNYRNEFVKTLNDRKFFIDTIGAMPFRISNEHCNSPQEQQYILNECITRILLDQTLKEEDLHYFLNLLGDLLEEFTLCAVNGNECFLQDNIEVEMADCDVKSMTGISTPISLSKLEYKDLRILETYCKAKFEACESLKNKIQDRFNVKIKPSSPKITLDLSVGEIALLFKLLLKDKILISDNQEEMYRTIASTFSSKKATDISVSSLKNKFLSPDPTTVEKMDIVLTRLKQILGELKNKK
jgi:hypothetical protein